MNNVPLISVIIAVHNGQKYIKETLDSILAQTYQDFEVIVVVNCSNDNTSNILNQFKDHRIKIFETNICQLNFNLNYALSKATGKYIARIDADDIATPDRFLQQIECIDKYNYDVVGSNVEYIDENSNSIGYKYYPETNEDIRKHIYYRSTIVHPSVMYKKDVILKYSGYMNGKLSEDYDLWIRLMRDKNIQFYNIQKNLTKYRIHPLQAKGNKYPYAEIAGYFLREALYLKSVKSFMGCLVYIGKTLLK